MSVTATTPKIYPNCYFRIKVPDYDTIGSFTECSGLEFRFEVTQYSEGGNNDSVFQLPGNLMYPNLIFSGGMCDQDKLQKWVWKTRIDPELKEVTLQFLDAAGTVLRTWTFADAFPVSWRGPSFTASGGSVATEVLEIAHSGLKGA
jgi:phage tail-like protein